MYCYILYIYRYMYTHKGVLPSYKKEWISAICSNVDGPWEYYA